MASAGHVLVEVLLDAASSYEPGGDRNVNVRAASIAAQRLVSAQVVEQSADGRLLIDANAVLGDLLVLLMGALHSDGEDVHAAVALLRQAVHEARD